MVLDHPPWLGQLSIDLLSGKLLRCGHGDPAVGGEPLVMVQRRADRL